MAFDAGMLSEVLLEVKNEALGAKIEKIYQPEKDQIVLLMRSQSGGRRLLIDAGANNPRIGFTFTQKENPMTAPMFCMLLRKHLTGAKLTELTQPGFERVAMLGFDTFDELGFRCKRYLVAEVMGKYSNLMFTDENMKIISVLKSVDFSTSSRRQVLPGMMYEMPPKQEKKDPTKESFEDFSAEFEKMPKEKSADKFITTVYLGISAVLAREIVFRATRHTDTPLIYCHADELWKAFSEVMDDIREGRALPTQVSDEGGRPVEFCFTDLTQYSEPMQKRHFETLGELLDSFYDGRDREMRVRQRAADILHLLSSAESRLIRKIEAQEGELAECERGAEYKKMGDLITANLYRIERGAKHVSLTDYSDQREDGSFGVFEIDLDERLSPAANAQKIYKKYNKAKNAKIELTKQIELARAELSYIYTVFDSLTKAETSADLAEIREELYSSGYASKIKAAAPKKASSPAYLRFRTSGGFDVLCGKNNVQNEYVTHRIADKNDYWFHAKGVPGSHVVMLCGGREPDTTDFTQAAEIAAQYSKAAGGVNVGVDYTLARNVKKPAGAKPGFVIYHTNWTAYVTPDAERVASLRIK